MTTSAVRDAGELERLTTEVRGAVNALLGLTDLLLDTPLDNTQRQYVDVLRATADRLLSIGGDTAALTENESRTYSFVHMDVRETVAQIADLARALATGMPIGISSTVSETVEGQILGDRQYVEQGLLSLVKICIGMPGVRSIELSATRLNSEEMSFCVTAATPHQTADFGEDVEAMVHRAQRFILGLSVDTQPAGVQMTFNAAVRSDESSEQLANQTRRVLLVEDAPDNQFIVRAFLRQEPYRLDVVSSGLDAVERIRIRHYDVILMDLEMPGIDGVDATRLIREWEQSIGRTPVPIVALTARSGMDNLSECFSQGFSGYLSKPVNKPALLAALGAYIAAVQ